MTVSYDNNLIDAIERLEWENTRLNVDLNRKKEEFELLETKNESLMKDNEKISQEFNRLSDRFNIINNLYQSCYMSQQQQQVENITGDQNQIISSISQNFNNKLNKKDETIRDLNKKFEIMNIELLKYKEYKIKYEEMSEKLRYTEQLEKKNREIGKILYRPEKLS